MFIKSINAQPDDNQACRVSFSTEHIDYSLTTDSEVSFDEAGIDFVFDVKIV
jgi:hypothetical protein